MHQYWLINCDKGITYNYYKMLTIGKLGVKYMGTTCTSQQCWASKTVLKFKKKKTFLFYFPLKEEKDISSKYPMGIYYKTC